MKYKKLLLPAIILLVAIIAMAVYSAVTHIAYKPTIAEKDFPFSITYELNGKTETIEGIYAASYTGNGGYVSTTTRLYKGQIISQWEDIDDSFILSKGDDGSIILYTQFYPDYMMGDPAYTYFNDDFSPSLVYYDSEGNAYEDEQTLLKHGVKLISWEYPEPVENTFVFSHISYLNGEVVIPLVIIGTLALLAVILFVKKEKIFIRKTVDLISVTLNFVIALGFLPIMTIWGFLSDIVGSSPELSHQMIYLIPAITLLSLAASVSLRRKGFRKGGLLVQLAGPAFFAVTFILCSI